MFLVVVVVVVLGCCFFHARGQGVDNERLAHLLIDVSYLTLHFFTVFDKQASNVQSPWIPQSLLDRLELPVVVTTGIAC